MDRPCYQALDQTAARPYTTGEYVRRALWRCVEVTLIRFSPPRAHGWRRFWLRRFGATLGDHAAIRPTTRVVHPWLLTLGDYSILGDGVLVYNLGPVTVGSHTVVSQRAHLCAGTHDYTKPSLPLVRAAIEIGSGVWVCAEAFIGPGVKVGDNAIVAARAVVSSDVEPAAIVAGNPARLVKTRQPPDARPVA